ncbi:MAG: TerB family tellurite resistance protein [Flavipsychrobacter sp.]
MYYKEAVLCLMFAMAEADGEVDNNELITIITMKNIFTNYDEVSIIALYKSYQVKFAESSFVEIVGAMLKQIPAELHMGTLSLLADVAVSDFDVDGQESASFSIIANAMNVSDTALKTILLTSLSKKLLIDIGKKQ